MRLRLIPFLVIFLAVVLAGAALTLYFYVQQNLVERTELRISNWADDLLVDIAEQPESFLKQPEKFILPSQSSEFAGSRVLVQLMDDKGRLLARSPGLKLNALPFTLGEDDVLKDFELEDGTRLKIYQRQIDVGGRVLGYVIVGANSSDIPGVLNNLRNVLVVVMLGALALIGFGVYAFTSASLLERQRKFLDFASHELRTPLSVIAGHAEVALRREQSPAGYQETLRTIKEESDWMNKLVANFLFLSRSEAGGERPKKSLFNFGELLTDAASALKKRYPRKDLTLVLPPEAGIKADPDRIRQLVNNLLENAAKYTAEDGRIGIKLSADPTGYTLEVGDNGVGIAPPLRKKIFDPFYRIDQKANEGMGLGLAISRWIVAAHGGRISVRSEPGRGSTFTVYLPK